MMNKHVYGLADGHLTILAACDRMEIKEKEARKGLGERVLKELKATVQDQMPGKKRGLLPDGR
jgi:hypothetical protein